MSEQSLREQYERANNYRALAFAERPLIGSPGAPAQAETNASNIWAHLNGGFLFAYEYTRWWHESRALRTTAVLGDWSWLNKVLVTGPDAQAFLDFCTCKSLAHQQVGQIVYTPMLSAEGKVAIEGLTLKLAEDRFLFTQSGAQSWLARMRAQTGHRVELRDVTPDFTCFALQGPRALETLEAVTGEPFADLRFSRLRTVALLGTETIVARQGVTGEVGYEFLMPTANGNAHELWRRIREAGAGFGLRELGFKAQMVGHTETGIATVVRDYLPARMAPDQVARFARLWTTPEELAALDHDLAAEHFCSPAELGWAHTIDLDAGDFHGREAMRLEAEAGGPRRRLVGLSWSSDDMAALYAALFRDEDSAPPPDLPCGQFRLQFLPVKRDGERVGWASGIAYSPTLRRMISLARIDRQHAEPGNEVRVAWGGFSGEPTAAIRAAVTELPFIRQQRRRDLTAG